MLYFAYGSNMSIRRLHARTPSAGFVTVATLHGHELRFHKAGRDGSAKCDAFANGDPGHRVVGVVFELDPAEKPALDRVEGLGQGYEEKTIELTAQAGRIVTACTYYATHIDPGLRPYHWYKHHVLSGARDHGLPEPYLQRIEAVAAIADPQPERHRREMAIYTDL